MGKASWQKIEVERVSAIDKTSRTGTENSRRKSSAL
jgi:hypothetical protein